MNEDKVYKLAKGFYGRAKNCWRTAKPKVEKALQYSYRDRRTKKRVLRSIWISQINAASRQHGLIYSQLAHGLAVSNIALNRKSLATLAVHEPYSFWAVCNQVQSTIKWRDWRAKQMSSVPQRVSFEAMPFEEVIKQLDQEDQILASPRMASLEDTIEKTFGDLIKKAEIQNKADVASGKLPNGKPQYEMNKDERAKFLKDVASKKAKEGPKAGHADKNKKK